MSPKKIPLLIISGLTATGKTSLAVNLAKKYNGHLVSADSRQIYRGLDIGTGKDHPPGFPISLIDIINPDQVFSVADFKLLAENEIKKITKAGQLPIIVGGTGYYIKSLFSPQTSAVPPHPTFRQIGNHLPLFVLQLGNFFLNHRQYVKLNNSEKHNPQRLIRKLEITIFPSKKSMPFTSANYNYLHLCLTASRQHIRQRIDQRVKSRLKAGLIAEIKNLLKKYNWSDPGLNTLAYKEFSAYLKHPSAENKKQAILTWSHDEHAYAKRQLTWFKKQDNLHFFDINKKSFPASVNKLVSKWYNKL